MPNDPVPPARAERPRVLAIDPGRVRVGLALSDALGITAQGLETFVRGRGSLFGHLAGLIAEHGVARIVVGLPRNMDGSEGESAAAARALAGKLIGHFHLPVELWDERLTSAAARAAFPAGSRKDWDRLAAVFILQSWLDAGGAQQEGPS